MMCGSREVFGGGVGMVLTSESGPETNGSVGERIIAS